MNYHFEKNKFINSLSPFSIHYNIIGKNNDITPIPHWHEAIEIIFMVSGTLKCMSDYGETVAAEGAFIYISPYISHNFLNLTESCKYLCIKIDLSLLEEHNYLINTAPIYSSNLSPAVQSLRIIENEFNNKEEDLCFIIKHHLLAILAYVNRATKDEVSIISNQQFYKIRIGIKYINEHLSEDITIKDISSHIGFSESHFSRCFRAVTKMTVSTYINMIRCKHAYYLIVQLNKNVSEAAEICGYTNMSYFTKRFKEIYNVLPSKIK